MTERDFLISFERQLINIIPNYLNGSKLKSDTIYYYINRAKDEYVKQLYRIFQQNQEITDKLKTLVTTKTYRYSDFTVYNNRFITTYPDDCMFVLGEQVRIQIKNNKCINRIVKNQDVIEATIETVDKILGNSLSEHHLHHGQAKPVRLYTDGKIVLYTDGNYNIDQYKLTYLKPAKDIGKNPQQEYEDLPEVTHQEIVDMAVQMLINQAATFTYNTSDKSKDNKE